MSEFIDHVNAMTVPEGQVGLFSLGQAGYYLKTSKGTRIALDAYLSDCCNRYFGFKRLMPYITDARELAPDILLCSHAHYDHFDIDSVPTLMGPSTVMIGAKDTQVEVERLNLKGDIRYLSVGDTTTAKDLKVTAISCDHGELAPDALGLLLEIDGKKIYYMGDTAYRETFPELASLQGVDVLILPINGAFGNLDSKQATETVKKLKPKRAIPCHYWNFAEHGGNPFEFMACMQEAKLSYTLLRMGEGILI